MIYVDFSYYGDDNSRLASLHKAWAPQNLASKVGYRGEACQPHHLRQILLATVGYQLFVLLRHSAHNVHMICFNTSDTIWASMKPFCVFFFFFEQKVKENPTSNVSWSLSYDQLGANTDLSIKQKKKKKKKKKRMKKKKKKKGLLKFMGLKKKGV